MAEVTLKNVSKSYAGGVLALKCFNLEVADGEFVALVGPSGCGKTTALRLIAGLERPTSGEIYIGGRNAADLPAAERGVAMVFQSYALYEHMTAFENIAFALKAHGLSREQAEARVSAAAETLDLSDCLERSVKTLSGGQRQRVAIGRALVCEPKVFLMDEPLANLDSALRAQMRSQLVKLRRRVDATFIYVTHDQTEAMTLGDRIVVMDSGEIRQAGAPQTVFARPENTFAASFIGSPPMNFIRAQVERDEGGFALTVCGRRFALPEEMSAALKKSVGAKRAALLGIRPENLFVSASGSALACEMDYCELLGSEVYLHAVTQSDERLTARIPAANMPKGSESGFTAGESVSLDFDIARCSIFDAESGKSLLEN